MGSGGKGERNIPGLVSFIMFLMSLGWTGAICRFVSVMVVKMGWNKQAC